MIDFAAARRTMVDCQVRPSDVTDLRIIAAMLELPRERFVAPENADLAYLDLDVPVTAVTGSGQARRLLKPMVLAKMVQAAAVKSGDHVLDVGCASGYSSALLARLAHSVVALEEDPALARLARENLTAVGAGNVVVETGPLTDGWRAASPYDVIFLDGATEVVPERAVPTAQRWRPSHRRGRAPADRSGHGLPAGRRRYQRMAGFRRRCSGPSGLCRAAGLRILSPNSASFSTDLGVARKHQAGRFRETVIIRPTSMACQPHCG